MLTQQDRFFGPRNIALLCGEPGLCVREIVALDTKGSLVNMRRQLVRWFGPVAAARLGLREGALALRDLADRATSYRLPGSPSSLRAIAHRFGITYTVEKNANDPALLERLRAYELDVVVSFSAPQVFGPALLTIPRLGCFNLHSSLLPRYRGLLPSFWVLFQEETLTGATVHLMDAGIDTGSILGQVEVDIRGLHTMREVLHATKIAGGDLMLRVLRDARDGRLSPRANPPGDGDYFTWPTAEQAREFRRRGYRLA